MKQIGKEWTGRGVRCAALALGVALCATAVVAAPDGFETGPVITAYGPTAAVPAAPPFAEDASFKIALDISEGGEKGAINRRIESAARLVNMHARAGLAPDRTHVAVIVHGSAGLDLVRDERYGGVNANAALIADLIEAGVRVELCGQTAAARGIAPEDLLPGVTMSLSAMTSHALLQQAGYTLNPF